MIKDIKKKISIIIPVKNEEKYISKCLDSLVNQDYPHENYEIIILEGRSTDNTKIILNNYKLKFNELIQIYDNPKQIQVIGRNIGIKMSLGDIIVMLSGHSFVGKKYLESISKAFNNYEKDIAVIGANILIPEDETFFGKVLAEVQMSFLGGAGSGFRVFHKDEFIDAPGFPAYKREIIDKIGLHDEKFKTGEDTDLNWRIKKAGFKLMVCSNAIAYYYRRHNNFKLLAKHMLNYGIGRAAFMKKHPTSFKIINAFPMLLVILAGLLPVLYLLSNVLFITDSFLLILYLISIGINSIYIALRKKNYQYILSFAITMIEHFSFGLGTIRGLIKT